MKIKDIVPGEYYILARDKKSRIGCAKGCFKNMLNQKIQVLKKLNNFNNSNTIYIQGIQKNDTGFELVSFWCSPYDLKEIS